MTTYEKFMKFLGEHWKALALGAAALAVATVCIFFPPTLIALGVFVLASSSAFAVFGASAVGVATVVVAGLAAATTVGAGLIAASVVNALNWFAAKVIKLFSKAAPDAPPAAPSAGIDGSDGRPASPSRGADEIAAATTEITTHRAWASAAQYARPNVSSPKRSDEDSSSYDSSDNESPEIALHAAVSDHAFRQNVASPLPHRARRGSDAEAYEPARVLLGAGVSSTSPEETLRFTSVVPSAVAPRPVLAPVPERVPTPYPHSTPFNELNDSLAAAIASGVSASRAAHAAPATPPSSPTGYAASVEEEEYSTSPVRALTAAPSSSPIDRPFTPVFNGIGMTGPAAQVAGASSLMAGSTSLVPKPLSPLGLAAASRIPSAINVHPTAAAASSHLRASGLGFLTPPPARTRQPADNSHLPAIVR